MAARVLSRILKIREMLPEIQVDDSSDDAFMVDGIGTGIRFHWPIPVGSGYQQNTTSRLGGHNLLLQKRVVLAPPYSQGYSTQSGTRIQLIYQHFPDGFQRSAARQLS